MTLAVEADPLGESRDFSLVLDQGEIDVTSRDSARWGEQLSGRRGWTVNFDHLYITGDPAKKTILAHYEDGSPATLTVLITVATQTFTAEANLASYTMNVPYEGAVEASGTLHGTGALTISVS
jgi:predicted secreted protein